MDGKEMSGMSQMYLTLDAAAKAHLNDLIFTYYEGKVASGPFNGMKLLPDMSWKDGNTGTKVLGCYEQELHVFLEEEIVRLNALDRPARILDVGCSEGYYAVGMALRVKDAEIVAVDNAQSALNMCNVAAIENKVSFETRLDIPFDFQPDLVISDCEGYEEDFIDLEKFPGLKTSSLVVECHDSSLRPNLSQNIAERLDDTHNIGFIFEGFRDPNQFQLLKGMHSTARWIAISEGRPCQMHWMLARPK